MEDTEQINNISRCSTRISSEDGTDLYGSGILYIGVNEQNAFVFTAAHVICNIWKGSEFTELHKLRLALQDGENDCQTIELDCRVISDNMGNIQEGDIYIHEKYDEESYIFDAAMICIPRRDWMVGLDPFQITESEISEKQVGYGFPQSAEIESVKKGQSEMSGKIDLNGTVLNKEESKYSFDYGKMVQVEGANRANIMKGYSGCGLFAMKNRSLALCGIVSSAYGLETAGSVTWVSRAALLLEIMKQQKISPQLPQSFIPYKEIVKEEFGIICREEGEYFEYVADKLIQNEDLIPQKLYENDFDKIRCDSGKWYCDEYWKGQLKKAVVLGGLKDIKVSNLKNPQISISKSSKSETVQIKFLCTDDKFETVIIDLIKKDYFANGKIVDKTIFLWNGKEERKDLFKRKTFRSIMINIVHGKRDKYSTNEWYEKLSELLPQAEGYVKFDIIEGGLSNCNLALIGIGRMMESLLNVDGDIEKMKKQFDDQIKEIWEVEE